MMVGQLAAGLVVCVQPPAGVKLSYFHKVITHSDSLSL